MATDRSTKIRLSTAPPPRTLNVQKFAESRASEVEALHSIVSKRLNNDFRSRRNKRRRTTGYDNRGAKNRYRKKQKVGLVDASNDDTLEKGKKKAPRYIRRKVELRKNPQTGFCTSGDGTKRLRTHIWHAKRFTMTKLWGFHLSLGLQGRGRGSRALLKRVKHGAVVHDASYTGAVQLEGPEDLLLSILSAVLVPSLSAHSEELSRNVLSGVIYACAMLRHVGPHFSHTIAPVTYMWRPIHQQCNTGVDREGHNIDGCDDPNKNGSSSSFRQVWVWIHAAAFKEGYDALKSVCQKQMDESGTSIKCISLEGQIAKLEVMGSKACQLLRKTLHPVSSSVAEADIETQLKNAPNFDEEQISASSIISLTVNDPRVSTIKGVAVIPEESIKEDETKGQQDLTRIPEREIEVRSSLCLKPEVSGDLSGSIDLWDASNGICPPLEESVLCTEKHHQRLAFFCLSDRNSVELNESNKGQCSRLCPILLLRHSNLRDTITRWSIILPLSWVRAFWVPLISSGAHAIGLREKRWVSSEVCLPYFPSDFPDCKAYSCFMETEAAVSDHTAILCPPSMRPFRVPIPPPWDSVQFSFQQKSIQVGDGQSSLEEPCDKNMINDSSGFPLEGSVARTSYMLTCFSNNINGDNLLLFPNMADRKRCISKFMKDEGMLGRGPTGPISSSYGKKLCFIRVLLHAYKEGVFEEGAVVCAPHYTDITLWTYRSDNDKVELQIPESSSKSYFVQQPSGKWELQVPKDPVANESHRWPIGFVTSGFVQGSKKPVAVALCEAVLMAHLREEQWHGVAVKQRRKEIYVLVRNLRSTAYRLALANIILEQQEDVDYL